MHITHESAEELVIHAPARGARILGTIFLGIGGVLTLIAIVVGVGNLIAGDVGSAVGAGVVFGLFGVVLTIGGVVAWVRAQDTDYYFDGKDRMLTVVNRRGETVIPFTEIITAELSVNAADEGPDSYGLKLLLRSAPSKAEDRAWVITRGGNLGLKLRGIHYSLEMCQLLKSGTRAKNAEMAEKIIRLLEA